ncbi:CHC2 zinc finger domain-containing protein [Eubacteriales bacterium OttesenSCG-928-A19]|nr:CHC2 zinc finger domain-containing protein [Eubacteriales bacterium OttesenSCG-928-A19]
MNASLTALFEKARAIPAMDVARMAGLELRQRGSRLWASCPLHSDRTPSLTFFDDGGWHCFGCGASGADGTSFYAALHTISQSEAARQLIEQHGLEGPARPSPHAFTRTIKAWRAGELKRLRALQDMAIKQAQKSMEGIPRDAPFPDAFAQAVHAQTDIAALMAWIEEASTVELYHMMIGSDVNE